MYPLRRQVSVHGDVREEAGGNGRILPRRYKEMGDVEACRRLFKEYESHMKCGRVQHTLLVEAVMQVGMHSPFVGLLMPCSQ